MEDEILLGSTWRDKDAHARVVRVTALDGDKVVVEDTKTGKVGKIALKSFTKRFWKVSVPA